MLKKIDHAEWAAEYSDSAEKIKAKIKEYQKLSKTETNEESINSRINHYKSILRELNHIAEILNRRGKKWHDTDSGI